MEIQLCGLTIRIVEGDKATILDIPNYKSRTELENIIEETLKNYKMLKQINELIQEIPNKGEVSDGYHTFDELYE